MRAQPDSLTERIAALCRRYLREPIGFYREDGEPVIEFDPPLDAAEQAILARIIRVARLGIDVTPAEWALLEPALDTLRTFRQLSDAEFGAMTAAQRDTALIRAVRALIDVDRVLLRD